MKNGDIYIAMFHQPPPSESDLKLRQREFVLEALEKGMISKDEVIEALKAIREG